MYFEWTEPFFANTHPQLLVSHSAEMFPSFICTHSSKRCYVLLLAMNISDCIVYSIHTVRNKWGRESSPSQCEQQVLGRRGRVSQGRTSGEDGVGSAASPLFRHSNPSPFTMVDISFCNRRIIGSLKIDRRSPRIPSQKKVYCFKPPCRPPDHMAQHSNRQNSTEFQNNYNYKR